MAATLAAGRRPCRRRRTELPASSPVRNNISSFRMLDWQGYFENTRKGAILVDITSRALHYWSEDQSIYRLYPPRCRCPKS
jgi:hypothetical protein